MSRFIPIDRDTAYLFPPSVQEWLPQDHLARFVVDMVEQLDLSQLTRAYAGKGEAAHSPAVLVALLFYGYATGEFSSRRIERATYDSVAFWFVAANTHPDHDTIATFRKRFTGQLRGLFVQILHLAHAMKLLKVGNVSLDGSKVKANASKHKALSHGYAQRIEVHLLGEVQQLLSMAEKVDRREMHQPLDIPAELARREDRLAAIRAAKAEIEARAQQREQAERKVYEAKLAARQEREKRAGKKFGGKPPKPPTGGVREKDQVNLTDGESRIMQASDGGFEQSYNVQALVDVDSKLIVGAFVTQAPIDMHQLKPALQALKALPAEWGQPEHLLADTGYFSQDNVRACVQAGITPLIAMKRDHHHLSLLERFALSPPPPESDDPLIQLHHRLATAQGRALYAKRKTTSEPVFGGIKHAMRLRQFLRRGLNAVSGEFNLVAIAWNLRRMRTLALAT